MSESSLDKLERLASILERLEGVMDKIPRLVELLGVAVFAGRASHNLGGSFVNGAIGGAVADGLVHSNLPHNQIGGVALGTYFAALGVLNLVPSIDAEVNEARKDATTDNTIITTAEDCQERGGIVIAGTATPGQIFCRLGAN